MYTMPSVDDLNAILGNHISDFCTCELTDNSLNHCAHFVSHQAGFQFGYTCFNQTGKGSREDRANIRVHEVFARCAAVGTWANKPAVLTSGLIFITKTSNVNVATKVMGNIPKKHIGFFHNNTVWHYSNSRRQVVTMPDTTFSGHYSGSGFGLFYGEMPLI